MDNEGVQVRNRKCFVARRGFVELGHFDKNFFKSTKKGPRRETFWCLFLDTLIKFILNGKFNANMDSVKVFFLK